MALASTDRALVRRITALLQGAGIVPKDENGWTLSTTRAAAWVMTLLRAAAWDARSDAVLDWLKAVPALSAPDQGALERWLRRNTLQTWASAVQWLAAHPERQPQIAASAAQIEALRQPLAAARPLAAWLASLRQQLQASGQWTALLQDDAGARVLLELHLHEGLDEDLADVEGAARKLSLQDFTHWADQVLEATRFKPDWEGGEPAVVLLPLAQLLARPFVALVLPGCDEKRLQTAPEPPGAWTAAQRASLGLPRAPAWNWPSASCATSPARSTASARSGRRATIRRISAPFCAAARTASARFTPPIATSPPRSTPSSPPIRKRRSSSPGTARARCC